MSDETKTASSPIDEMFASVPGGARLTHFVANRRSLESMPIEWQQQFAALVRELFIKWPSKDDLRRRRSCGSGAMQ
jgi:hypothetical protein